MIENLISKVLETRNSSHIEHWKTNSFSKHKALGSFYDGIIPLLDKYVEAHQGLFGLIKDVPGESEDIVEMMRKDVIWLTENRDSVSNNVPALENVFDDMTTLYLKTLYKLENLR